MLFIALLQSFRKSALCVLFIWLFGVVQYFCIIAQVCDALAICYEVVLLSIGFTIASYRKGL